MGDRNVKDIHVDRESEKQLFRQMLEGEAEAHILLIKADGGFGKTFLLDEFGEMSKTVPGRTNIIKFHASQTSESILFDSCFQIGQENFNQFTDVCQEILGFAHEQETLPQQKRNELRRILSEQFSLEEQGRIAFEMGITFENIPGQTPDAKATQLILFVERNNRLGDLIMQVRRERPHIMTNFELGQRATELNYTMRERVGRNVSKMDREQRLVYRRLLTAAFLDDLTQLQMWLQQRLVFIFDTFNEDINADVKDWVSDFINSARRLPWLIVVVAGRQFPSLPFDDQTSCYRHVLKPFKLHDLQEFARQAGLNLEPEFLDLLHKGTEGKPLTLATILDNLSKPRAEK